MLKIVARHPDRGAATLSLEGRVIGPWVGALSQACREVLSSGATLTLDLAGVAFVERDGVSLLKRLVEDGVGVVNCPAFVTEQLKSAWPR